MQGEREDGLEFLNGDLIQMYKQKEILQNKGIFISTIGSIPVVESSDYEKTLLIIWNEKIEGWWNYEKDLISLGICTEEEYKTELFKD